jgi:NDP-sugar pyrophosphorylase family protein
MHLVYFGNKKIEFIIEKKATGTAGILKKILKKKNKSDLIIIYSDTFHENEQEKIIKEVIRVNDDLYFVFEFME